MQLRLFHKPFSDDCFKKEPLTKQSVISDLLSEIKHLKNSIRTHKGNYAKLKENKNRIG